MTKDEILDWLDVITMDLRVLEGKIYNVINDYDVEIDSSQERDLLSCARKAEQTMRKVCSLGVALLDEE